MSTEIQRIPGKFNLPGDWPKLVIPNTTSGLYADFKASTLALGSLDGQWRSSGGNTPFTLASRINPSSPSAPPVVTRDANGLQRVTFDGSNRLDSSPNPFPAMPAEITILATFRPTRWTDPADPNSHIRVVTGPGPTYRSIQMNSAVPGTYLAAGVPGNAVVPTPLALGELTQVAARFGASAVTGDVYGVGSTKATSSGTVTTQTAVFVGANGEGNPLGHFKGDIYRIQIWGRVLTDTDVASAMASNAITYKF